MTVLTQWVLLLSLLTSPLLMAKEIPFSILHTNDWQSRLLGVGPNSEYTPNSINDDQTIGGVARLATLIDDRQKALGEQPILLLDGGDISQGTLFHTLYRKHAPELRLMKTLGYDAVTLGNHEFDFRSDGLSKMLEAAKEHLQELPPIITSNLKLPPAQQHLQKDGTILEWKVIEKHDIRFGLFGLIGNEAAEVLAPDDNPAVFADQITTAKNMVKLLREEQNADVVILMSHSGVRRMEDGSWGGEEVQYAQQVPGIDVIVGGHSHTLLMEPIMVGETAIVQAGSGTRYLGELNLGIDESGKVSVKHYQLHRIDDSMLGKPDVTVQVEKFKSLINQEVMTGDFSFYRPLVQTPKTLTRDYSDNALGNLVADGIRFASGSDIALTTNSLIRDDLIAGESGVQSVSDIFRLQPLGIGPDDQPGYPLMKIWMTAKEIRGLMEVMSFAYMIKGNDYYPHFSGLRFIYNTLRPPLDRITSIELGSDELGYVPLDLSDDSKLFSFSASSYVGSFARTISELSYGLVNIVPKDRHGQPVTDLNDSIIDRDPKIPGIQEYKNWQAQLNYFAQLPDVDGNGIGDIVLDQHITSPRMQAISSLKLSDLVANATPIVWVCVLVLLLLAVLLIMLITRIARRFRNAV
ncbi:bifunctional metallophosphatase/5'-nucleotidase [Microbulbifer spongiae]|uniref:Bifunctional metallophosphatase/5'-nucleotidase n=1 Tax=Microbulbifer spongiae TaxID=2944933 RepID=A0ABY9E9R7_9GAMM|nr:bifunctional UDP-sugar hydrolase/5'-nucleotidase [Microbulbifer sp. MI-G]WKD49748.1 bifunctional metallophosphatase/5'-nucleotidase [Microbulbifer sp. MI-G]